MKRGAVTVGAAQRAVTDNLAARLPPADVELMLEVDDVADERDLVVAAGWYCLRISNRAGPRSPHGPSCDTPLAMRRLLFTVTLAGY